MRSFALFKAAALSSVAFLSIVLIAGSVAHDAAASSRKPVSSAVSEAEFPAPTLTEGLMRVRSSAKRARSSFAKPALATALQATAGTIPAAPERTPVPTLLAAVDHDDIKAHHRALADAVLRALPADCRTHLRNFYVKYADVKQRGLGGKTTIIIDGTAPDAEFAALLVHECGHVTHANLHGNPQSGESPFRDGKAAIYNDAPITSFFAISWMTEGVLKQDANKKTDFVSGYAQSDAFEDFAETFAMYILHRQALRERAATSPAIAAKLAWMEAHLPIAENILGESAYTWNKQVPWDVTKLPYRLGVGG